MFIFVEKLKLDIFIGLQEKEYHSPQRVLVSFQVFLKSYEHHNDSIENSICYQSIIDKIKHYTGTGHIKLVETLAEHVIQLCLENEKAERAIVTVEKPNIIPETHSVGVCIERSKA